MEQAAEVQGRVVEEDWKDVYVHRYYTPSPPWAGWGLKAVDLGDTATALNTWNTNEQVLALQLPCRQS